MAEGVRAEEVQRPFPELAGLLSSHDLVFDGLALVVSARQELEQGTGPHPDDDPKVQAVFDTTDPNLAASLEALRATLPGLHQATVNTSKALDRVRDTRTTLLAEAYDELGIEEESASEQT